LVEQGVPRRKYTAVVTVTLDDGTRREEVVVEEGWVIAVGLAGLADAFEQAIDFDPERITSMRVESSV
jgi:hypothetical protein